MSTISTISTGLLPSYYQTTMDNYGVYGVYSVYKDFQSLLMFHSVSRSALVQCLEAGT
jgi:hypothetical protein